MEVPIPACRVCLATETKLFNLCENNLKIIFEDFIGFTINLNNGLPKHICSDCKARILRIEEFRKWCRNVQDLLENTLAEDSFISKEFMQEINKTFPKNNLTITEQLKITKQLKIDINDTELQHASNESLLGALLVKKEGNTEQGDKIFLEEDMLPLTKNYDVIANRYTIKSEDDNYEQYEVLDEDLIDICETKDSEPSSEYIENISINESLCKTDTESYNSNAASINKTQRCFLEIDCGKILLGGCDAKKTITTNAKAKTTNTKDKTTNAKDKITNTKDKTTNAKNKITNTQNKTTNTKDEIAKSPTILDTEEISNKPVKKRYKKKKKGKTTTFSSVRRKYCEWLMTLKDMTEERLKQYNMKLNKELSKEEQLAKMLARKDTEKYKTSLYKCELCCKGFMSGKAFKSHNIHHKPTATRPVECDLCHVYLGARSLKTHERQHRLELVCLRCGEYVTPAKMKAHFEYHAGVKYECKECDKVFYYHSTYGNHVRIHHADTACSICGELFNGRNGVFMHVRKSHLEEAKEQCDSCEHYFCTKEALQRHLLNTCSTENSPCGWCGAGVPTAAQLADHIPREHNVSAAGDTHSCTECGRSFKRELTLACHWRKEHHDRPNIPHKRTHITTPKKKTQRRNRPPQKFFQTICDMCGVSVYSNYLPVHKMLHTGEKPHQCPVCQKRFRIKNALGIHMMVHSGEKPYKCTECDLRFRQSCHLINHRRIHTGERPFECGVCHKAFSLKVNKDEHVRTVHEGLPPRRRKRKGSHLGEAQ